MGEREPRSRSRRSEARARAPLTVDLLPKARQGSAGGTSMGLAARRVVAALRDRDVDPAALLDRAGIDAAALDDRSARVAAAAEARLIELAADAAGDPAFALHLATRGSADEAGLVSLVLSTTPCMRETIRLIPEYDQIANESVRHSVAFTARGAVVELRYFGLLRRNLRSASEFQIAALVQSLRDSTGHDFSPVQVSFAHTRTDDRKPFERFLRCPVEFGAETDELVLSRETLDLANRRADPYLFQTLRPFADEEIATRDIPARTFREAVDNTIFRILARGEPTVEAIAQSLAVSPRTLSRRLAEEGTTFPEVLTTLRRSLAMQYIQEPGLSIDQIALLLGYSEVASFSHAFRRWTGVSPSAARRAQAVEPALAERRIEFAALI